MILTSLSDFIQFIQENLLFKKNLGNDDYYDANSVVVMYLSQHGGETEVATYLSFLKTKSSQKGTVVVMAQIVLEKVSQIERQRGHRHVKESQI